MVTAGRGIPMGYGTITLKNGKILQETDAINYLRTVCTEIVGAPTIQEKDLMSEMLKFVKAKHEYAKTLLRGSYIAVGLAANQLNQPNPKRIIAFKASKGEVIPNEEAGANRKSEYYVLYNPYISDASYSDEVIGKENCLSAVGKGVLPVKRYAEIVVKGLDPHGNEVSLRCRGKTSSRVQHEIDHLDGVMYYD